MQFRLTYRGPLRANGNVDGKHRIRTWFHVQLRQLWQQPPLNRLTREGDTILARPPVPNKFTTVLEQVDQFWFAPLVTTRLKVVALLDILMLRPEPPGAIILHGGDIDNRLKTLLDALRMPQNADEIPRDWRPGPEEDPFFCLLQDDALVTSIGVTTDRLLEPREASDVDLVILVTLKGTGATWLNMELIA